MKTKTVETQKSLPFRPLPPIQTVFAPLPAPKLPPPERLTDQQVENWRNHLIHVLGPFALLLDGEAIENVRDGVQDKFPPLVERIGNRVTSVSNGNAVIPPPLSENTVLKQTATQPEGTP